VSAKKTLSLTKTLRVGSTSYAEHMTRGDERGGVTVRVPRFTTTVTLYAANVSAGKFRKIGANMDRGQLDELIHALCAARDFLELRK